MVANYEAYGFMVSARKVPETCTECPFWTFSSETLEGMCYITGHIIATDEVQDEKRMDDCQICKKENKRDRIRKEKKSEIKKNESLKKKTGKGSK